MKGVEGGCGMTLIKIILFLGFLVVGFTVIALLVGCSGGGGGPSMEPIGDGLSFIGIGLVVMALVFVLGSFRS